MKVVYTAIIGGYDQLKDPLAAEQGVTYVCFTDNPKLESNVWQIRPLHSSLGNKSRISRLPKILAHRYVEASESVWVDGSILIKGPLMSYLSSLNSQIAAFSHWRRDIYHEARVVRGRLEREEIVNQQIKRYREYVPPRSGLWQGRVVYRMHTPEVEQFNEKWWLEYTTGACRDQLSLGALLATTAVNKATAPRSKMPELLAVRSHNRRTR